MLYLYLSVYFRAKERLDRKFRLNKELEFWRQNKEAVLAQGGGGYKVRTESLGIDPDELELLRKRQNDSRVNVIADIDIDGFFLSHVGKIQNAPTVSKEQFRSRKRSHLQVVDVGGYAGVKKNYRGKLYSFVNEMRALHLLGLDRCKVPAIMDIDFDVPSLTFSFILGRILREELAKRGAVLRNRDVENHPDFVGLNPNERRLKCIQEGRRFLYDVVDQQFVKDLRAELGKVHAIGILWNDIKYGNIVIEEKTNQPYLLDFEYCRYYPNPKKKFFHILCDRDLKKFELHFEPMGSIYDRTRN